VAQRLGRGIALLFHDHGTRRGECSAAHPGRTLPPGKTRYPLYRRLGGPQGRYGRAENLVHTGIRSRTVLSVVSRYTDWATRPTYTYIHTVQNIYPVYTGCPRRNVPDFGRVFLMLNYTDITQNTYIQSWTVTELMAREVWNFDTCYSLIDYQIHIETGRNMWFL